MAIVRLPCNADQQRSIVQTGDWGVRLCSTTTAMSCMVCKYIMHHSECRVWWVNANHLVVYNIHFACATAVPVFLNYLGCFRLAPEKPGNLAFRVFFCSNLLLCYTELLDPSFAGAFALYTLYGREGSLLFSKGNPLTLQGLHLLSLQALAAQYVRAALLLLDPF
jgi:hypothetical protein